MLGDIINGSLLMILGYAYPAFECYKIVEKNKVDIETLRFWCQYWILVAILTVCESITDIFLSWFPFYGEMKVAFFVYLWYPKTQGTAFVYQTLLRPYFSKHETDIDRKIQEMRARTWDFLVCYGANFIQIGQAKFFEILRFMAGQSAAFSNATGVQSKQAHAQQTPNAPPPPPNGFQSPSARYKKGPSPFSPRAEQSESFKSNLAQVHTRMTEGGGPDKLVRQRANISK